MTTSRKINKNTSANNDRYYNNKDTIYAKIVNYVMPFVPDGIFKLYENFFCIYYSLKTASTPFTFKGKKYKYFNHIYNHTWNNERRVEIPIIWDIIKDKKSANILEVGNVLSHYFPINHDVIDKYEKGIAVINEDIATYKPKKKYDYIVSISTLEHVGWDEPEKDKTKIIQALKNLKTMLSPNGKIVFTIPLGYNPYMDDLIIHEKLNLDEQYYLRRISKDNLWEESKLNKSSRISYNSPFPLANGIIIGVINNV